MARTKATFIFRAKNAKWPEGILEGLDVERTPFYSHHLPDFPQYRREGFYSISQDPKDLSYDLVVEKKFDANIPIDHGRDRVIVTLRSDISANYDPIFLKIDVNAKKLGLERVWDEVVEGTHK